MPNKTLSIDQVISLLGQTAPRIGELTADLAPAQLVSAPSEDEWSASDVLAHLRACADIWGGCIVSVVAGSRALRAVNPRTWIDSTDYRDQDFRSSLRAFAAQRAELLTMLGPLPRDKWSLSATVTGAGSPLQRDALFYGRWLAGHERAHVKQIARIASSIRK